MSNRSCGDGSKAGVNSSSKKDFINGMTTVTGNKNHDQFHYLLNKRINCPAGHTRGDGSKAGVNSSWKRDFIDGMTTVTGNKNHNKFHYLFN